MVSKTSLILSYTSLPLICLAGTLLDNHQYLHTFDAPLRCLKEICERGIEHTIEAAGQYWLGFIPWRFAGSRAFAKTGSSFQLETSTMEELCGWPESSQLMERTRSPTLPCTAYKTEGEIQEVVGAAIV